VVGGELQGGVQLRRQRAGESARRVLRRPQRAAQGRRGRVFRGARSGDRAAVRAGSPLAPSVSSMVTTSRCLAWVSFAPRNWRRRCRTASLTIPPHPLGHRRRRGRTVSHQLRLRGAAPGPPRFPTSVVGVDLAVWSLSTGEHIGNPKSRNRLADASRAPEPAGGSPAGRLGCSKRTVALLARCYRRAAKMRRDAAHRLTSALAEKPARR